MVRVLLTGASGFVAAHVLEALLAQGHSVVASVRSTDKADFIKKSHPNATKSQLDFVIVEDVAKEGAFDEAIKSDPPFDAVLHTASPFHFNATDIQKELLDPAVMGTTGILKSIKKNAPTVKRVVITSSFAAIVDVSKGLWPEHTYTEKDWNPVSHEKALSDNMNGYQGSKTFAEKAAWDFIENEKPNFTLATINPPLIFGPVVHYLNDLKSLNTSNQLIRDFMHGSAKKEIPPTRVHLWVDVRDVALGHVKAMQVPDAANKRFLFTAGYFSNREIIDIMRKNFSDLQSELPGDNVEGGRLPDDLYKADTSQARNVLGIKFRPLDSCIPDLVKSLKQVGA